MPDPIDRDNLMEAACNALLRWLFDQHESGKSTSELKEFEDHPTAEYLGQRFHSIRPFRTEIYDAAERLDAGGLIVALSREIVPRGMWSPYQRARITDDGIECVRDFEGDTVTYGRHRRRLRERKPSQHDVGGTHNYLGPIIMGSVQGAQLAWNVQGGVNQNRDKVEQIAAGFESLAQAVADLLRQLPQIGLDQDAQRDVEEVADEVLTEVVQPQPEPRKLRRAVAALTGYLMPIATGAIAGVSDEARELAHKAAADIASAL